MKDSNGAQSKTLGFVTLAFIAGTLGFLSTIWNGKPPPLTDYGVFVSTCILPWLGREWIKGKKNDNDSH